MVEKEVIINFVKKEEGRFDVIYVFIYEKNYVYFVFQQNLILLQVHTPKKAVEINQFTKKKSSEKKHSVKFFFRIH